MRSFSRRALGALAMAAAGVLAAGVGLAGAADSGSGGVSSDVQLVQSDPSTTVPDQGPDDGAAPDRHCDHEGNGSSPGRPTGDRSQSNTQALYRHGQPSSLRWG